MRKLMIDTDTASDDAVALIMALREKKDVKVEAITVVAGNVPIDLAVKKNALISVEMAGTYSPPVYKGWLSLNEGIIHSRICTWGRWNGRYGLT